MELHHANVAVADLERSRRFYRDVLRLTEIERPPFDVPGAWFAIGAGQLHVSETAHPIPVVAGPIDPRDGHFAVRIADFAEALDHLRSLGYGEDAEGALRLRVHHRTVAGVAQIYLRDPDGHLIELNAVAG